MKSKSVMFLFVVTLVMVGFMQYSVQADSCITIPPNQPWIQYSRFIAWQIEKLDNVDRCWVTNRTGFEHFRASNYIWSLDGTAGPITSFPSVELRSPVSPIFLPIIYH